jgi:hypothetical protein
VVNFYGSLSLFHPVCQKHSLESCFCWKTFNWGSENIGRSRVRSLHDRTRKLGICFEKQLFDPCRAVFYEHGVAVFTVRHNAMILVDAVEFVGPTAEAIRE